MTGLDAERFGKRRVPALVGQVSAWTAGITFLAIFVVNIGQIGLRAVGGGWVWVTDASQLLLLWTVMLGTVGAYCYGEHIVTGFLEDRLHGTSLRILLLCIRAIELAFFLTLVIAGWAVTTSRSGIPYVQLGVSTGWAYAAIPTAGLLLLVAALFLPLRPPTPSLQASHSNGDQSP